MTILILETEELIHGAADLKQRVDGALADASDIRIDVSRLERADLSCVQTLVALGIAAARLDIPLQADGLVGSPLAKAFERAAIDTAVLSHQPAPRQAGHTTQDRT